MSPVGYFAGGFLVGVAWVPLWSVIAGTALPIARPLPTVPLVSTNPCTRADQI